MKQKTIESNYKPCWNILAVGRLDDDFTEAILFWYRIIFIEMELTEHKKARQHDPYVP